MIKVKITENGQAIELEFEEADDMKTALASVSDMLLKLSRPLSTVMPKADQAVMPPKTMQSPDPSAISQKEKKAEILKRARRLNNEGGRSQTVCIVDSMKELGVPVTAEEVYQYMLNTPHIGFSTSAAVPLHGIKQALRSKTRLFSDIGNKVYVLAAGAEELATSKRNLSHKGQSSQTLFQDAPSV